MSEVSKWILSICSAIILGALIDIIIPEGGTRRFIKGVFAIILLFVIVSPLPNLINNGFSFNFGGGGINIDRGVVQESYRQRVRLLESETERTLEQRGYPGVNVAIFVDRYDADMRILSVSCNIFHLAENKKNKTEIAAIVAEYLKISVGSVSVYG